MIGNRLFVASLDGIKFIDIDNLNTTVTWSTGEVGNKIEVNPISTSPGNTVTYSATVSYGAVTGSDQVTFTLPTKPTITASGATTFCQGGSVTLTANSSPAGVYSYTWQTGAITQGITVASAGSYSVTAVNSIGCSETSTPTIITVNDLPAAPIANSVSLNYNGLQQTTPDLIPPSGQSISWFTLPVGGVNSSKPQGINVGTYNSYANAIIDATGCISSSRTLVFLTINKKSITITVDPNQTKVYGAANPSTYTYGVSPSLTGLSALNGSLTRVAGETVGTYAIQQNDLTTVNNPNYTITYVGDNFTITQKPITITADAGQTKVYGATDPSTYVYTVSPSITGLASLTGSLIRVVGETVGPYAIQQNDLTTANNPNYTITYVGNNFTITQKPITITVDPNQTKVYGAANPSTYTYGVSPSLTGLSALNGSLTRVAGETVGTYAIQQNDLTTVNNPNYTITYVGDNFTITQKPITITADAGQTKVYGATDPSTYVYTVSPSITGLASLTGSLIRVVGETVGPYAIQQNDLTTANNPNYTITYVGNNFTITQKPITITVDAGQTKVYGAANPLTYTYAVSPSLAGLAALNGTLTRVSGETVGPYAIEQNDLTTSNNPNYTINYVGNNFTITKKSLTITADNKTKFYGAANPIFTYTYSGLVNGDLATFTWPTIITTADQNSPAGTYPIIPSAATDPNYTITYVDGILTVTKTALTITAKPHAILYNGTNYSGGNGVILTGMATGESISNLTGTLNYKGTSQGAINVGTYTIIPDGLSSPNYNINYVGDALEIKKATLKIIAGNQIVNFGTPTSKILTDATFTYASLLGGDNASAITGSLSYSTNYTPLTSPGSTGIYIEPIITGLSAANYELIAEKGNITITALLTSSAFQMPNAFTPNSDGHNDTFKIIQNGYVTSIISFRIFTKSGKLIFSDKDGSWDGRYAGVMLDSDVYIWIADFMNKNNVQEHLTGTVLLLK